MRKTFLIMKREYLEHVRKKSFIIGTIAAPIIMLALYSIPILSMFFVPDEQLRLSVLDRSGGVIAAEFVDTVKDTLDDGRPRYVMNIVEGVDYDAERERLVEQIKAQQVDIVIDIPADVLESSRIYYISENVLNERVTDYVRGVLNPIVISQRFSAEGIDAVRVAEMTRRVRLSQQKVTKDGVLEGGAVAGELAIAIVYVMILYYMLLAWGMSVQRSVIQEKSSRVIEVLLSSVDAREMFFGKIIGVGAVGMTQIAIWGVLFMAIAFSSAVVASQFSQFIQIAPMDIVFLMVYFVLGFLFYSSIFTIVGAICSTEQDAQQLQGIIIMPLVIPIMLMFLIIQNPDSNVAVVLSMIPFFTPMLMLARIAVSDPGFWQIALSIVLLIISTYFTTVFSAKVFRVGILMYGKRPSLREVIRWSRYA